MKLAPALATLLLAAAGGAHAAAEVEVAFVAPDRFTDIGGDTLQRQDNLKLLGDYFQKVGAKSLADGSTLRLAVDDVDLAGRPKLFHRTGGDYRILTGGADWPRIRLHWVLQVPGAADRRGEATLADLNYLQRMPRWRGDEPLGHEKRMIDDWFKATFAGAASAAPTP